MGDTLIKVAINIYIDNAMFELWDISQVIVDTRRTRVVKNKIFVGDKTSTIYSPTSLFELKNKWTDYMDLVQHLVSVNAGS